MGSFMPKVKGAKKMAIFRPRKNYGSHGARKVPRRYELYDILEKIDETIPTYTVVSEPEEPLQPVFDVPLKERYPWAEPLDKVPLKKRIEEESWETGMEPYFGSYTKQNLPPIGRRQNYVHRRGWPRYNHPPWINRPLIGSGEDFKKEKFHGVEFKKDRRPDKWKQMTEVAFDDAEFEEDEEFDEDLDEALDAME